MQKSLPLSISLLALLLATMACGLSGPPINEPDPVGTIVAQTMGAVTPAPASTATSAAPTLPTLMLPTLSAGTSAVPTLPAAGPTLAVPGAERINFLSGATTGVETGTVAAGASKTYVLQATQAQPMMVNVDSPDHDVTLSLKTQGGTNMVSPSAGEATWQGSLPVTEDYYLTVHGGASTQNYTLTITIPSRIKFLPGKDQDKITGKTVGGYNVLYTVFAIKDQKMTVDVSPLNGEAALTIYGFSDGQPYLRYVSEQTHFSFRLPATQDYIIEVVPKAGATINYLLVVKIQ